MDGNNMEASDVAVTPETPISTSEETPSPTATSTETPTETPTSTATSTPTSTRRQLLGQAGGAALDTALLGGAVGATLVAASAAPALREKPTGFSLNPFSWFHKSEATPKDTSTTTPGFTYDGSLATPTDTPTETGTPLSPEPTSSQTAEQPVVPVVPGENPSTVLGKIANLVGLAKKP